MLVTVIGRGHSGTRAMSHTLSASGVFMGEPLNEAGDLLPAEAMYDACRVLAPHVRWNGGIDWDFSSLHSAKIPPEFEALLRTYLTSVFSSPAKHSGWKIPETTLVFPWVLRLFPKAKYIFWIRDPRDCILGEHLTDDLRDFGISYPLTDDQRLRRAYSWRYQYDLVQATPRPENWIEVRFEDFVLRQDETLARLETFLGVKLAKIPVRADSVGRWKSAAGTTWFEFLRPALLAHGYEIPAHVDQPKEKVC